MLISIEPTQVKTPLILTLDVGTSSTRAMLFDRHARPVTGIIAQVANQLRTTAGGGAEFDPADILAGVVTVIDQVLDLAGSLAKQITGVATDTFVTNIVGIDAVGRALTPVFTYADTRCAPDAAALRQEFDLTSVYHRTGCRIHSSYLPARFRWLERTHPDWLKAAAHWVSVGEYLMSEFLGQRLVSYSVASWTGLLNRNHLKWDEEWLSHLPIDTRQLSPLTDVDRPLGGLRRKWAKRWPALKNVLWFPAVGDGAAANLGSGCQTPQRVALTIGTTGAMRVVLHENIAGLPEGLWCYRIDRQRALLGGATSEGGNLFAWLTNTLQLPPQPQLEQELSRLKPAAHGLIFLPFVAGERAPGWHDEARASLIGFGQNTRPIEILRAGLEGVAYRFALIHERITPHLPPNHQIIASGGGLLSSPTWLQIMADVLGRPLIASTIKEATSRGAALLALEALGYTVDEPVDPGKTYQPNLAHRARYDQALKGQLKAYQVFVDRDETATS